VALHREERARRRLAAAPNFIWDASGYDGALIQSFYPPDASADWARSTEYSRHSIKHYSEKWFPYPYPTAINVAGPVVGWNTR